MVVANNHQVSGKAFVRVSMSVKVPDVVDNSTLLWLEFTFFEVPLYSDVMVPGKDQKGDPVANCIKNARHLVVLLPCDRGDTVLDVPEKNQRIGLCSINSFLETFKPCSTAALKVHPMGSKIRFDAKMEVGNNEMPHLANDDKGRAITEKLKIHSALTDPFWGW